MTSGQVGDRGDYGPVKDPTRFAQGPLAGNAKRQFPEMIVFDNQTNSSGSTIYSTAYPCMRASGVTCTKGGTGDVEVQVSSNPGSGIWFLVDTMSVDPDIHFSGQNYYPWIRFGLKTGTANVTVYLSRNYQAF